MQMNMVLNLIFVCLCVCVYIIRLLELYMQSFQDNAWHVVNIWKKFSFCFTIIIFMVFIIYCCKLTFPILPPLIMGFLEYPYLDLIESTS